MRIVVGFAAGSAFDILARLIGQWLSERLGEPFIVENRSGAAGSIATEAAARARPDGYTLLVSGSPEAINEIRRSHPGGVGRRALRRAHCDFAVRVAHVSRSRSN